MTTTTQQAATGGSIEVRSPYDDAHVGEVPRHDAEHVSREIAIAAEALGTEHPPHERAAVLERAVALVEERADELATSIMREAGKPITIARAEVERCADTLRYSAIEARTLAGDVVPLAGSAAGAGHVAYTMRMPKGVVAAITPFNFPLNLCAHKVGPAIAAGCPVVHKPASSTPLTAQLLHRLLLDAGLPEERYRLVFGSGREVGGAIAGDERIAHITFTGSGPVGWGLRAETPRASVSLELGNSTPLLAFADADLEAVASAVASKGFGFAGQSCIAVQRVLVERSVHAELRDRIVDAVGRLGVGDPADEATVSGPVIDDDARDKVLGMIASAREAGAELLCGGDHDGRVIQPAVLDGVPPETDLACDELFGPAVAIMPFDDGGEDAAVRLANGTPYGLQAGIYTCDITRAMRLAPRLEFGGVTVNEAPTWRADQMPYGGIKESGNTREGPAWAVREMTEERLVVIKT